MYCEESVLTSASRRSYYARTSLSREICCAIATVERTSTMKRAFLLRGSPRHIDEIPLGRVRGGRRFFLVSLTVAVVVLVASSITTAWLWHPTLAHAAGSSWIATGSLLQTPRVGFDAVTLQNGKVLIGGGNDNLGGGPTTDSELYDPSSGAWSETGNMTTGRQAFTMTLLSDGTVLAAGGVG